MKLILNLAGKKQEREFLNPDGTVVVAAIKSLIYDSTILLEDGADFVNCWAQNEDSFQFQYQDGKTLSIYRTRKEWITYEELLSIFMKFLDQDSSWKNDFEFQLADYQPDLDEILDHAELKSSAMPSRDEVGAKWMPPSTPAAATTPMVEETAAVSQYSVSALADPKSVQAQAIMPPYTPSSSLIWERGRVNEKILCPHCGARGTVHTQKDSRKVGVSGGKATGALLTAGLSLFVTGLSRKEKFTAAYCGNCEAEWSF